MDETEYLLSNPANRRRLDQAIAELNRGAGVILTPEEWDRITKSTGEVAEAMPSPNKAE
ncbi:type II toxin-antitoxin system Phd/YefM family antitoxin [Oleomonas cavernae]|uniref:hypothetical protein n=1 Tax=Oleomonas cavernae TaxID=2320859 RepID=UPI001314313D|nr:hypothetical protein [Oleomonas cavernae]